MNKVYSQEQAFWSRVKIAGPDECWEWQGKLTKRGGYGQLPFTTWESRRANRYSYYLNVDRNFDRSLDVCHSCDNPPCVNPRHLWLGTRKDNLIDMCNKNRHPNKKKTHCRKGHEYTLENTYIYKNGRWCRECFRIKERKKRKMLANA